MRIKLTLIILLGYLLCGACSDSVKDSGAGISKENIDRIWDRFYKSDSSRGRDKKGSGLGLSIVKETLLAHNENIDVISTVGVGTEFIFSLPIAKSAENT